MSSKLVEGLSQAGIDFVGIFPSSVLAPAQFEIEADPRFMSVVTTNETEAVGVCAGAWLAGKSPALVMENSGLGLVPYSILRMQAAFGIPLLMVIDYRGEPGDGNWYLLPFGRATEPLLKSMSIQYEVIDDIDNAASSITRLYKSSLHSLYPTAVVLSHRMLLEEYS